MVFCLLISICGCGSNNKKEQGTNGANGITNSNSEQNCESTTMPEPTNETKLSDECEYVLASGTNDNGDFYELVANRSKSFDGKDQVGVIKNNKWLIPLSSDCPFIDETGAIINFANWKKHFDDNDRFFYDEIYYYIANDCFLLSPDQNSLNYQIIWNVETNLTYGEIGKCSFSVQYTYSDINDILKRDNYITNIDKCIVHTQDGFTSVCSILDTNTMTVITSFENLYYVSPYSEGLFFSIKDEERTEIGFYDEKGNMVIDLSSYPFIYAGGKYDNDLVFINGECTFKASNDSNKLFLITIDKTGKIIEEKELLY